jgi:hypothetical protein
VPVNAGQISRFIHEMRKGDLLIYPSKIDKQVHLGEVAGAYVHDARGAPHFPIRRPVKWLKVVPRTRFSQGALYEIGSALTFFQVRSYAEEFRAAFAGKAAPAPVEQAPPERDGIPDARLASGTGRRHRHPRPPRRTRLRAVDYQSAGQERREQHRRTDSEGTARQSRRPRIRAARHARRVYAAGALVRAARARSG